MDKKINKELYEEIYKTRFSFGKNWRDYLKVLDEKKIETAKLSLIKFTELNNFKEKSFIDIGCGSGLFSLCACLLNAKKVVSVDVDEESVECAKFLRKKFNIDSKTWEIKKDSALETSFLDTLGKHDIVYSWGVLHHTGNMWKALEHICTLVKKEGLLFLAIYNDFNGFPSSKTWHKIKKFYSKQGNIIRKMIEMMYICYYIMGLIIYGKNPIKYIKKYDQQSERGMSFYRDSVDWLGGFPYEYASKKEIIDFYKKKGFKIIKLKETKREGCNEFLFRKTQIEN